MALHHKDFRALITALKNNLPLALHLSKIFQAYIPNTTNSCDGSFAHWKSKVKLLKGLSKKKKKKNDRLSSNFLKPPSFFPIPYFPFFPHFFKHFTNKIFSSETKCKSTGKSNHGNESSKNSLRKFWCNITETGEMNTEAK